MFVSVSTLLPHLLQTLGLNFINIFVNIKVKVMLGYKLNSKGLCKHKIKCLIELNARISYREKSQELNTSLRKRTTDPLREFMSLDLIYQTAADSGLR